MSLHRLRAYTVTLGAAALTALAACADAPSAPAPRALAASHATPAYDRTGAPTVQVGALTRDVPLDAPITVEAKVTPGGGTLEIPEAGLHLVFPAGLVKKPTTFWATARAGSLVAYDFGPSAVFAQPVKMMQMLKGTSLWKVRDPGALQGAYFPSDASLNDAAERAFVTEFAPTVVDLQGSKLTIAVPHFSGWMVSTGRSGDDAGF